VDIFVSKEAHERPAENSVYAWRSWLLKNSLVLFHCEQANDSSFFVHWLSTIDFFQHRHWL
jgi:hypothetical protein